MGKSKKGESDSIGNQRNLILDFISKNPELQKAEVLEFCDDGFSGKNFERPGVRRMLEMAEQGEIQCIVVKDLSRFGRDYLTAGNYISRIFPFMGVRFLSINDGFDSARRRDMDSLDASFKMLLHDLYSQDLSRKVRSAQYLRAGKGEFLSSFAPFGYVKDEKDRKKLAIDFAAAEIVRRIFHMAAEGLGAGQIAGILNREEIPTPMGYKKAAGCSRKSWGRSGETNFWNGGTVRRILRDERYTGSSIYGKKRRKRVGSSQERAVPKEEWIVVENTHEGLVTREEFDLVQQKIQRPAGQKAGKGSKSRENSKSSENNKSRFCLPEQKRTFFCLKGKVRCGICGYAMARMKTKNPYYFCATLGVTELYDCPAEKIPEKDLEEAALRGLRMGIPYALGESHVWEETGYILEETDRILGETDRILGETDHIWGSRGCMREGKIFPQRQNTADKGSAAVNLQKSLRDAESRLQILYEQFALGELTQNEYMTKKEDTLRKKERLRQQLMEAQKTKGGGYTSGALQENRQGQRAAEQILKEIRIYPGKKLHIVWNFRK